MYAIRSYYAMNDEDPSVNYNQAILNANKNSQVTLSYDGKVTFEELGVTSTQAGLSIYDVNSDNYAITTGAMVV